jgi:hypothetical protein
MNPESAYECVACPNVFGDFEEAAHCCGYGYYDVFLCGECGTSYFTEYEAEACCQEEEDDSL